MITTWSRPLRSFRRPAPTCLVSAPSPTSDSSNGTSATPGPSATRTVNEFRFNYNREAQRTFQHPVFTSLRSELLSTCSIVANRYVRAGALLHRWHTRKCLRHSSQSRAPAREGFPFIQVSGGFTIGNNGEGEVPQVGNSFQWSDNLSKVVGNHSLKFGADVRRQRFDQTLYFDVNGEFFVDGTSTNTTVGDTVFSDYLLGFPGSYGQGSAQVENVRSTDCICLPRTAGRSSRT